MENEPQRDLGRPVKRLVTIESIAIGAMLLVSAWAWTRIPAGGKIAVHWGAAGQPDQFMGKTWGLLWMPIVAAAVSLLMLGFLVIPRTQVVRSMKAYAAVATAILAVLLGFHVVAVLAAVGWNIDMPAVVMTLVGSMFIVIGNYFTKMRRNRWMGVRVPWTRASEQCWDKTHRFASRLFIALGLLLIVIAWMGLSYGVQGTTALGGLFGVIIAIYAYSYVIWRIEQQSAIRQ